MNTLHKSIVLCGFMAAGKTTIGKMLSQRLALPFVDTDNLIVKKCQMPIPEIFAKYGEAYFRDVEHEVAKSIKDMKPSVVSSGGGMLTFERNATALKDSAIVICLDRAFGKIYPKLKSDSTRPMVYNKSEAEVKALYDMRMSLYKKYSTYVIANNRSASDCIDNIIELLNSKS